MKIFHTTASNNIIKYIFYLVTSLVDQNYILQQHLIKFHLYYRSFIATNKLELLFLRSRFSLLHTKEAYDQTFTRFSFQFVKIRGIHFCLVNYFVTIFTNQVFCTINAVFFLTRNYNTHCFFQLNACLVTINSPSDILIYSLPKFLYTSL